MRTASRAVSKQSLGDEAASTGRGDSPLRPNITCNRSDCSVLVGRPVDGPPRWTLTTMSGNSVITARFMASVLRAMPGPDETVTPSAPPKEAPIAEQTAAISSSAWKVVTPKFLYCDRSWSTSEAGVIGYAPRNSGRPLLRLAAISPMASDVLPMMLR